MTPPLLLTSFQSLTGIGLRLSFDKSEESAFEKQIFSRGVKIHPPSGDKGLKKLSKAVRCFQELVEENKEFQQLN